MLGLNFLVANQIDQAIDELSKAARGRRRSARDSPDPRQPVSREGPGRPRDPGAPGAAAAAEPAEAGTRQRAALPRARLPQRRLRRPRASRRSRKCCSSIRTTATRCRTSRSCTRISTSGPRPTRRGRSWRRCRRPRRRRRLAATQRDPRVPRERVRPGGAASAVDHRGSGAPLRGRDRASTRATRRRTSASATCSFRRGTSPRRGRGLGAAGRRVHPSAPTSRSRGSRRAYAQLGDAGSLPGALPTADRGQPAGLAGPARARRVTSRPGAAARGAGAAVRSARAPTRTRSSLHQAIWQTLSQLQLPPALVEPLRRADARRDLLSRSARLPALPLPQHRAALAVPALPRVEYVRRGADRAASASERRRQSCTVASHETERSDVTS